MIELIFAPILPVLVFPPLAFIPSVVFLVYFYRYRPRVNRPTMLALLLPAVLWMVYGVYEIRMFFWSQTVTAPIRIDLLLIVPVLDLLLAIGIVGCMAARRAP
ncbi:MAG: hypothetical protein O7I93_15400 [Gemmatimonadetes bacterium]|nr:hypothetical protein [Gemmatimonadota bacterium]